MLPELIWYPIIGAAAGVLAGLLGIGGGLIVVPALMAVMPVPREILAHVAIGTSLASIAFTSISSARAHHRRGAVDWPLVMSLGPGLAVGAFAGAAAAHVLRSDHLQAIFGVFLLLVGFQMLLGLKPAAHRGRPGPMSATTVGGIIGLVSGVVGIGGGTMTVPYLAWCNVPIRQAIAVSAACGLPIAIAGAAGFIIFGAGAGLPSGSGYVYWPAFLGVAVTSVFTSPLGAALAHRLPISTLRKAFALLAMAVAARLLLTSLRP